VGLQPGFCRPIGFVHLGSLPFSLIAFKIKDIYESLLHSRKKGIIIIIIFFYLRSQVAQAHELPPSPVAWDKV